MGQTMRRTVKVWVAAVCVLVVASVGVGSALWAEAGAKAQFVRIGLGQVASGLAEAVIGLRNPHYGQGTSAAALRADGAGKFGFAHASGAWSTIAQTLVDSGMSETTAMNMETILEQFEVYAPPSPSGGAAISPATRKRIYRWTDEFLADFNDKSTQSRLQSIEQSAPRLIQLYRSYHNDPFFQTILAP